MKNFCKSFCIFITPFLFCCDAMSMWLAIDNQSSKYVYVAVESTGQNVCPYVPTWNTGVWIHPKHYNLGVLAASFTASADTQTCGANCYYTYKICASGTQDVATALKNCASFTVRFGEWMSSPAVDAIGTTYFSKNRSNLTDVTSGDVSVTVVKNAYHTQILLINDPPSGQPGTITGSPNVGVDIGHC